MEGTVQLVSIPKNKILDQGGGVEEDIMMEGERVEEQYLPNQDVSVNIGEAVTNIEMKPGLINQELMPPPGVRYLTDSSKSITLARHYNRIHQKVLPHDQCSIKEGVEVLAFQEVKVAGVKLAEGQRVCNGIGNFGVTGESTVALHQCHNREPLAGAGFHFLINSTEEEEYMKRTLLKCLYCEFKTESAVSLTRHTNRVHQKKFSCDQCSFRTGRKEMLNAHVTSNHSTSFKCPNCSFEATSRVELHKHVLIYHEGVKTFPCTLCPYTAVRKNHLDRHVISVHEMTKAFECTQCEYKTPRKDKLDRHFSSVHQKLKPFACTFCSYRASRKSNLTKHMSNFHIKRLEISL